MMEAANYVNEDIYRVAVPIIIKCLFVMKCYVICFAMSAVVLAYIKHYICWFCAQADCVMMHL